VLAAARCTIRWRPGDRRAPVDQRVPVLQQPLAEVDGAPEEGGGARAARHAPPVAVGAHHHAAQGRAAHQRPQRVRRDLACGPHEWMVLAPCANGSVRAPEQRPGAHRRRTSARARPCTSAAAPARRWQTAAPCAPAPACRCAMRHLPARALQVRPGGQGAHRERVAVPDGGGPVDVRRGLALRPGLPPAAERNGGAHSEQGGRGRDLLDAPAPRPLWGAPATVISLLLLAADNFRTDA